LFATISARAIDLDEIERALRPPQTCPGDPSPVKFLTYTQNCGENYMATMSTSDGLQCQNETDRINNKINEYNALIRRCRDMYRNSPSKPAPKLPPVRSNPMPSVPAPSNSADRRAKIEACYDVCAANINAANEVCAKMFRQGDKSGASACAQRALDNYGTPCAIACNKRY